MGRIAFALFILVLASPCDATAAHRHRYAQSTFHWPWETHYRVLHHRLHQRTATPPDCAEINDGIKMMDADHFDKAWCQSTRAQQEIVAKCSTQERVAKCSTIKP